MYVNEDKWSVSANDLSLFQCFLCQENPLNLFSFLKLASCLKLVARERISSSQLKFLPKWTLWVFLYSIRIRGNIKAFKIHIG